MRINGSLISFKNLLPGRLVKSTSIGRSALYFIILDVPKKHGNSFGEDVYGISAFSFKEKRITTFHLTLKGMHELDQQLNHHFSDYYGTYLELIV